MAFEISLKRTSADANITGDPVTNLVYAVCHQAVVDSDKGDRDAKQWWYRTWNCG